MFAFVFPKEYCIEYEDPGFSVKWKINCISSFKEISYSRKKILSFNNTFYFSHFHMFCWNYKDSQVVLVVKNLPANAGDLRDMSLIPGLVDPLEKEVVPHSSILAWGVTWTEEPGRL